MITTKASITLYACPLSFRSSQDKGRLGGLADLEAWTLVHDFFALFAWTYTI
jgi:hypothetical protein